MNVLSSERTKIKPVCERACEKGDVCDGTWKNNRWECSKCGKPMGPAVASVRTENVLLVRLSTIELQKLVASIGVPNEVFRDRETLEMHLNQAVRLFIADQEVNEGQMEWARETLVEHMPELKRHFS